MPRIMEQLLNSGAIEYDCRMVRFEMRSIYDDPNLRQRVAQLMT